MRPGNTQPRSSNARRRWEPSALSTIVVLALTVAAVPVAAPTAVAQVAADARDADLAGPGQSTKVRPVKPTPRPVLAAAAHRVAATPPVRWPKPGVAVMSVNATEGRSAAQLPVVVGPPRTNPAVQAPGGGRMEVPDRVRVEVLDRSVAYRVGMPGFLFRAAPDGGSTSGRVSVQIDYSGFRDAFGGDYGARLVLWQFPACLLDRPGVAACARGRAIPARNEARTNRITADITLSGGTGRSAGDAGHQPSVYAVTAASGGPAGDLTPTSLAPSATWQVGTQSGDFTWSYPVSVPRVPGPTPEVSLSYSSGSVDGRTASTNNQSSWIGEGFGFQPGFIERSYQPCGEDMAGGTNAIATGDRCWATENGRLVQSVHVVAPGLTSELVLDDATGQWRAARDAGWRVALATGVANGDDNGEHWVLTAPDGTRYFFGRHSLPGGQVTNSAWTVPVYGNHANEPCARPSFADSWCQQAYRWALDYVVDTHGDVMAYHYGTDVGRYARNNTPDAATPYVRDGWLERIGYGMRVRDGALTEPAAGVALTVASRCVEGSACVPSQPADWPDVPWDRDCAAGAPCQVFAPTFWSSKRLAAVVTRVRMAGADVDVATWRLRHQFLESGDGTSPSLWLASITHAGHVGGQAAMPAVTFDGMLTANRVNATDDLPDMKKWRVNRILTETGGQIDVHYATTDCVAESLPAPDRNIGRCFPGYWLPAGAVSPKLDWFAKNVVTRVTETDLVAGNPMRVTDYDYGGGLAWRYDESELVDDRYKTWGQLRGYQRVTVRTGGADGPRTRTEQLFFRGMDGDRYADGTNREATVVDSTGSTLPDEQALAGIARETIDYAADGSEISGTMTWPEAVGPTATRDRDSGRLAAYLALIRKTQTRTTLAGGGARVTESRRGYDSLGRLVSTDDLGDLSVAGDEQCTLSWYATNTADWILDRESRRESVATGCDADPDYPAQLITDTRYYHDDSVVHGAPPSVGDITRTEEATGWDGGPTYQVVDTTEVDDHGRTVASTDALGRRTTTDYTPAVGGPVTTVRVTNPLGHETSTDLDPTSGQETVTEDANGRRIERAYDALGRLTAVWLPDRSRSDGDSANQTFEYLVRADGPTTVTSRKLQSNGSFTVSVELFDGFLRSRQTQASSPAGGRIVTDTFHDSRGQIARTYHGWWNSALPAGQLVAPTVPVAGQTAYRYDEVGRRTAEIFLVEDQERWRTSTAYGGDSESVTPPAGGTATTKTFDARDQLVELRQHHGGQAAGAFDATQYSYTPRGLLRSVTDPAGNVSTFDYDLGGNPTRVVVPDAGVRTATFDAAGQATSRTDAEGHTLAYRYDQLGRRTAVFEGSTSGPKLAEWVFDTVPGGKGLPAATVRHLDGDDYRTEVTGYDVAGRPTATAVVVPAVEGALGGRYVTSRTYDAAGKVATTTLPAVADLPAETLQHSYNAVGLPAALRSGLTSYLNVAYTSLGKVYRQTLGVSGRQIIRVYSYEPGTERLGRIQTQRQATPAAVADLHYTRDDAGNLTRFADLTAGRSADVQCATYDQLRRLTRAWTPGTDDCATAPQVGRLGGPAPYWHSYAYDVTGSRTSEVWHAAAGDTNRRYTYPSSPGQSRLLASVTATGPTGEQVESYRYDRDGNTVTRAADGRSEALTWGAEGHLTSINAGRPDSSSFVYDADGNRLIRRDSTGATLYLPDMELRRNDGTGTVSGTRYYTQAGDTVAARTGRGLTWLIPDQHGTPTAAVDAATLTVSRQRSLPFGVSRGSETVDVPGERGYGGGQRNPNGFVHFGVRDYDPNIGRFVSADPVRDHTDPQQMHGYAYSNNNPFTFADPDGRRYVVPAAAWDPDSEQCNYFAQFGDFVCWDKHGNQQVPDREFCDDSQWGSGCEAWVDPDTWGTCGYTSCVNPIFSPNPFRDREDGPVCDQRGCLDRSACPLTGGTGPAIYCAGRRVSYSQPSYQSVQTVYVPPCNGWSQCLQPRGDDNVTLSNLLPVTPRPQAQPSAPTSSLPPWLSPSTNRPSGSGTGGPFGWVTGHTGVGQQNTSGRSSCVQTCRG